MTIQEPERLYKCDSCKNFYKIMFIEVVYSENGIRELCYKCKLERREI